MTVESGPATLPAVVINANVMLSNPDSAISAMGKSGTTKLRVYLVDRVGEYESVQWSAPKIKVIFERIYLSLNLQRKTYHAA